MLVAAVVITPIGGWAGGAGARSTRSRCSPGSASAISSSVIPYVADQLAMARLPRATYALMVALLPAIATVIGIVVLDPGARRRSRSRGVALVIAGVAVHRRPERSASARYGTRASAS